MIFTAIVYKSSARIQKTSATCIAENFEDAKKKLFSLYGRDLISIVFEVEKNLDITKKNSVQSN